MWGRIVVMGYKKSRMRTRSAFDTRLVRTATLTVAALAVGCVLSIPAIASGIALDFFRGHGEVAVMLSTFDRRTPPRLIYAR